MTNVTANLFVDVHPSTAIPTSFFDGNFFKIASTVSVYSLCQMFLRVLVDIDTNSPCNSLYDHRNFWFEVAFHGLSAKINPNQR